MVEERQLKAKSNDLPAKMDSSKKEKKVTSAFGEDFNKEITAMLAELSFIVLPFVVILIINLSRGEWTKIIQTSDWSMASTLLFGQTVVKIIMGVASQEHSFNYQGFGLISALIIVFGLIPSIIILVLFQFSQNLSSGLIITQFVLLGIAICVFLLFGTIGQVLFSTAFRHKISKRLGLIKQ